jgi:site-specific DNA recombinase
MKVNEGEVPQYVVEHSHDAIIDPQEWEAVQAEFGRRKKLGRQYSGNSVFATKIVCADCGAFFGSKVWHSTSKYKRTIWQCNRKFKNGEKCSTPHFDEQDLITRFLAVFNSLISTKETLLDDCRAIQTMLTDVSSIDTEIAALIQEIEVITELTKKCISENSQSVQSQEEYARKYNAYVERYEKAKAKLDRLEQQKVERLTKADAIGGFMFELSERNETLTEFDDRLWLTVIDKVTAYHDGRLVFKFQNGSEIEG